MMPEATEEISLDPMQARTGRLHAFKTPEPAELVRIFHPFIQIAIWERSVDSIIDRYIQEGLANNLFRNGFRTVIHPDENLPSEFLPRLPGCEEMADDVRFIGGLYSDLLGCDEIALRLEVMDGSMCPRFHVDRTGIRLICTYHGRGTEWINDEWVDREKLGPGSRGLADDAPDLFDERTKIEAATPFDIILLKGSLWQGNVRRGAIHRSPPAIAGKSRVVLIMDAIWT
jgi:hypothetical protein